VGGAHRNSGEAVATLKAAILEELKGCSAMKPKQLLQQRRAKFLAIG